MVRYTRLMPMGAILSVEKTMSRVVFSPFVRLPIWYVLVVFWVIDGLLLLTVTVIWSARESPSFRRITCALRSSPGLTPIGTVLIAVRAGFLRIAIWVLTFTGIGWRTLWPPVTSIQISGK